MIVYIIKTKELKLVNFLLRKLESSELDCQFDSMYIFIP